MAPRFRARSTTTSSGTRFIGRSICLYRGSEVLHAGNSAHALYNWLQKTYSFRLPAAHEIQMAEALVRQKMEGKIEREAKRQVKKRAPRHS